MLGGVAHKPWPAREAETRAGRRTGGPTRLSTPPRRSSMKGAVGRKHNEFKIDLAERTVAGALGDLAKQEAEHAATTSSASPSTASTAAPRSTGARGLQRRPQRRAHGLRLHRHRHHRPRARSPPSTPTAARSMPGVLLVMTHENAPQARRPAAGKGRGPHTPGSSPQLSDATRSGTSASRWRSWWRAPAEAARAAGEAILVSYKRAEPAPTISSGARPQAYDPKKGQRAASGDSKLGDVTRRSLAHP